jgi:hypothetical protein
MQKSIAVLCAQSKSVYSRLNGQILDSNSKPIRLEIFDVKRDAFTFSQSSQIIAHPPCRTWAKLKGFAKPSDYEMERELARFCVRQVIANGGILEHPFDSRLFYEMGLPLGGCSNELGFTLELPQRWFGHAMIKNTWLFCSKLDITKFEPIMLHLTEKPVMKITSLSRKAREATPVQMAIWMIKSIANQAL